MMCLFSLGLRAWICTCSNRTFGRHPWETELHATRPVLGIQLLQPNWESSIPSGSNCLGKSTSDPTTPQKKHHPKSFCLKSGSTTPLLGGRLTPELFTQSDWPIWKIEWKELVVTLPRNPVWRALLQVLWLPGSTSAMPVIHPRRRLHVFTLQTRSVY